MLSMVAGHSFFFFSFFSIRVFQYEYNSDSTPTDRHEDIVGLRNILIKIGPLLKHNETIDSVGGGGYSIVRTHGIGRVFPKAATHAQPTTQLQYFVNMLTSLCF